MQQELDRETHSPALELAVEPSPFVEASAPANGPLCWPYFVLALAALAAAMYPQFVNTTEGAMALSWPLLELPSVQGAIASLPDSAGPLAGFMLLVVSGLAAAALLALTASLAKGILRPLLMHAYAVFAWVALYAFDGLGAQIFDGPAWMHGENPLLPVAGMLGLVAAALVYAGAVARVRVPSSRVAGAAGVLGLLWFGVALLYPFSPPDMGFMQPVTLMFTEQGVWAHQVIGFFRLAAMVALAAAGVVCVLNLGDGPGARDRAKLARTVWWVHMALLIAAPLILLVYLRVPEPAPGEQFITAVANLGRHGLITFTLAFLAYVSAADLACEADKA
ncbi:MAG: hypothetical protein ACLFTT_06670 [Candidatus Hydrogenedentota bacterium]